MFLVLEKIMWDMVQDHRTSVFIRVRLVSNLPFADNIDLMVGSNSELKTLIDKFVTSARPYKMETITDKSEVMANTTGSSKAEI